jgi:hypothetical protein
MNLIALRRLVAAAAFAFSTMAATSSFAAPMLDQSYPGPAPNGWPDGFFGGYYQQLSQTFTVGISGFLEGLDIGFWKDASQAGQLTISLRNMTPDGTQLGSIVFDSSSITASGVFHFDLGALDLKVSAGDVLAITMVASLPNGLFEVQGGGGGYAGGQLYAKNSGAGPNWLNTGNDAIFATYVDPTPLPGALPLFLSGCGVMGGMLRWRMRRKGNATA